MFNNMKKVFSTYCILNRYWLIPLFAFPLLWIVGFRFSAIEQQKQNTLVTGFVIGLSCIQLILAFALGITLNEKGSRSWFTRLPFHNAGLTLLPCVLLAAFAGITYFLWPTIWIKAQSVTGYPFLFCMYVLPISVLLIVRSIKNTIFSRLCGGAFVAIIIFSVESFYAGWGANHMMELPFYLPVAQWLIGVATLVLILCVTWRAKSLRLPIFMLVFISSIITGSQAYRLFQEIRSNALVMQPIQTIAEEREAQTRQCLQQSDEIFIKTDPSDLKRAKKLFASYSFPTAVFKPIPMAPDPAHTTDLLKGEFFDAVIGIPSCSPFLFLQLGRIAIDATTKEFPTSQIIAHIVKFNRQESISIIQPMVVIQLLEELIEKQRIDDTFKQELAAIRTATYIQRDKQIKNMPSDILVRIPTRALVHEAFQNLSEELAFVKNAQRELEQLMQKMGPR